MSKLALILSTAAAVAFPVLAAFACAGLARFVMTAFCCPPPSEREDGK